VPAWIHNRAERLLQKNPEMDKGEAFAIATQQAHALGKTPQGYGTSEGRRTAKTKYRSPSEYQKTAEAQVWSAFFDEIEKIGQVGASAFKVPAAAVAKKLPGAIRPAGKALRGVAGGTGPASALGTHSMGSIPGTGVAKATPAIQTATPSFGGVAGPTHSSTSVPGT